MKKFLIISIAFVMFFMTGCGVKNNTTTDNNDGSDSNLSDKDNLETTTCTKNDKNESVKDESSYIIKHDGDTVKNVTMKMHYKLENETGKELYDTNKSVFTNIKDKFQDIVGVGTNIIEDTADMFHAEVTLDLEKMSDEDRNKFEDIKLSKDYNTQKKYLEDKGLTCK